MEFVCVCVYLRVCEASAAFDCAWHEMEKCVIKNWFTGITSPFIDSPLFVVTFRWPVKHTCKWQWQTPSSLFVLVVVLVLRQETMLCLSVWLVACLRVSLSDSLLPTSLTLYCMSPCVYIYITVSLSIYLSLFMPVFTCFPVCCLHICLRFHICLLVYIFISLHACLHICLPAYIFISLSTCLHIYLHVCLSMYLSVSLCFSLHVYIFISLFTYFVSLSTCLTDRFD